MCVRETLPHSDPVPRHSLPGRPLTVLSGLSGQQQPLHLLLPLRGKWPPDPLTLVYTGRDYISFSFLIHGA